MKALHFITLSALLFSFTACSNTNSPNNQSQYGNESALNEDSSSQIEELDTSEFINNTANPLPTRFFNVVAKVYALNEDKDFTYREDVELTVGVFKDGRIETLQPLKMPVEVNNSYQESKFHFICYHLVDNYPKAIYLFNTDELNVTW